MASLTIGNANAASALLSKCREKSFHTEQRMVEIYGRNMNWNGNLRYCRHLQGVYSIRASQSRGPLWRGRVLSNDSMQAVQAMKRAKGDENKIDRVFETRVLRLVKADLLAVYKELQRQNECDLAVRVFDFVRKEPWYKSDLSLYVSVIMGLKRNGLIEKVDSIFEEFKKEPLLPDTKAFTRLMTTFLRAGLPKHAVETYELMKQTGCKIDEYTFAVLIKGLQRLRERELTDAVIKEYRQFLNDPTEFLKDTPQNVVTS